ncbi:zinc finger BED domain-containing protein RICESLEEPER 2-like [Brassica rapa]|uniref:zinc finger BED domain-containing protein RICESLEEPER 2-like n=1 Tax=Brassica campestris TaxID=3711 RepID=UPI0004F1CA37|nr:zinc finger BED domain-containing protein RICESLEEPER 2-like [Brassica rapa]
MIVMVIVEHDLLYAFVEYKRVQEALHYANPTIEFWCRNTTVSDVLKIFEREKMKLRQVLRESPGRICLTTDLWRAITIEGYLCLTAHYVDAEWNLRAKILSFCAFPPPHSALAIAMKLMELIKEWGLHKKVFTVIVDNASSNDNMQGVLKRQLRKDLVCSGEIFHIRCAAHILNLIVQDGLAVISEALEKIMDSVKYVKVTESREMLFQGCVETLGIVKKGGLVLDVTTRWNSTYLMLSRALHYKEAFKNLAEIETSYKSLPTESEWLRAGLICDLLQPFDEMTRLISGSSYPTTNLYFMEVWKIQSWLGSNEFHEDTVIDDMVASMRLKFVKFWEEYIDILAIAAVLDLRLKFKVLEYYYHSADPATCKSRMDYIRKRMLKLYGVYKKNTTAHSSQEVEADALPAGLV